MKNLIKKFMTKSIVLTLVIILFTGCSKVSVSMALENQDLNTDYINDIDIEDVVYKDQSVDEEDGTVLIEMNITIPRIKNPNNDPAIEQINTYYENEATNFFKAIKEMDYIGAANEQYELSKEYDFSFMPYSIESTFSVEYNKDHFLSILNSQFEYTGGAHPNMYYFSENFDLTTGKKLELTDILKGSKEEVLSYIYDEVLKQIEGTQYSEGMPFYESYKTDIKTYYNDTDFILQSDGLNIYYQKYAIAPYVAGLQEFILPYEDIRDLLKINLSHAKINNNDIHEKIRDTARQLIEDNYNVFANIIYLSVLPYDMPIEYTGDTTVFPVKDQTFTTYKDLEEYIRNIYVKKESDILLDGEMWGGPQYINQDGVFCVDISKSFGIGYYKNWNTYRFQLSNISEDRADITVYLQEEDLSDNTLKDVTVSMKMIKENGKWLLEKMVY